MKLKSDISVNFSAAFYYRCRTFGQFSCSGGSAGLSKTCRCSFALSRWLSLRQASDTFRDWNRLNTKTGMGKLLRKLPHMSSGRDPISTHWLIECVYCYLIELWTKSTIGATASGCASGNYQDQAVYLGSLRYFLDHSSRLSVPYPFYILCH